MGVAPTQLPEITVTAKRDLPTPPIPPPAPPTPAQDVAGQTAPGAPLNDPAGPQGAVRRPLVQALQDGQPLAGLIRAEVENNSYYQADSFHLEFAASAAPPGWWDVEPPWLLDVQFSLNAAASWTSLLIGEVNHMVMNLQTGTLLVDGHDLSSRLIESPTQEAFVNQTSSQVATILAGRHNLSAQVTPTSTLVGRYYEGDHVRDTANQFSRTTTEWDLLIYLAQREGFDVFVSGTTLHFEPITSPDSNPFVVRWDHASAIPRMNITTLQMQRSLTLAKDIEVWVRSWSSQRGKGFVRKSRASGTRRASAVSGNSSGSSNTTQRYTYVRPNLTEAAAQALANQIAADLTRHERVLEIQMPGELALTARNLVQLTGTSTSFDQTYYISELRRSLSFHEGFRMSIRAKNSSPRSQTQVT